MLRSFTNSSDVELLGAVIGGNEQIQIATSLIETFGGNLKGVYHASISELKAQYGLGQVGANRIKAALFLAPHLYSPSEDDTYIVDSPDSVVRYIEREMSLFEQEHLYVLLLNTRNKIIGKVDLYTGTLNSSRVRIAEIFRPAIKANAAAIIVAHNHPSGNASPSPDDLSLTRDIVTLGKMLEIELLDHLVIGGVGNYVSIKSQRRITF